jgi:octaprenyl-diphosphate synthase
MSSPAAAPSAPSKDLGEIFVRLRPQMAALDRFMTGQIASFEPEIRDMAAYCLESSGKRLRPALVFIGGWRGEGVVNDDLVRVAGVVEMVHLATLVHDDIMDGADIRRNRRTAARAYGGDAAVLLGDALFSQALHIAAQFPTTEVCQIVSASTRQVCSGEIMQTLRRRDMSLSLADYMKIVDLKTAELFRVSCLLGSKIAGYPADFVAAAEKYGRHLGIAYQIYDDLVDFLGEESRIGKTLGTDLATGKLTLPLMLLFERLPATERAELVENLRAGRGWGLAASVERMRQLGIAPLVGAAIGREANTACDALRPHAAQPSAALMGALCELLRQQVRQLLPPT